MTDTQRLSTGSNPAPAPAATTSGLVRGSYRTPIVLGAFAVVGILLFVLFGRDGTSTLALSTRADAIQLTPLGVPTLATGYVVTVALVAIAAIAFWRVRSGTKVPLWLNALFAFLLLLGFLVWASADANLPVPGLLAGALALSVPLIFGALGGVISERVGVVNVAIEGQLLAGAFCSALVASITGNAFVGLIAAMVAGVLVSFVLAAFSIKYLVDQVIVGVVLNVLVSGLTGFLFSVLLSPNSSTLNSPPRFSTVSIPILSDIPIVGYVFFRQTFIVYLMYIAVIAVYIALFHTRWGLRLRAVGEHPQAADTVGIKVAATRFWNVAIAGAIAGLGGAFFTLGSVGAFGKEMTAGAGFIALAAVIFGRWDPIRATLAALLFGFASSLQGVLNIIGSPVPSEFLLMLPYLVTILAVAGFAGKVRGPAAAGKPYIKS